MSNEVRGGFNSQLWSISMAKCCRLGGFHVKM